MISRLPPRSSTFVSQSVLSVSLPIVERPAIDRVCLNSSFARRSILKIDTNDQCSWFSVFGVIYLSRLMEWGFPVLFGSLSGWLR